MSEMRKKIRVEDFLPRIPRSDFAEQLMGYRLTTAEILYHMPDHPDLLQSFTWQFQDLVPEFPVLRRFLKFWEENIEARLHSVTVASAALVKPAEVRFADREFRLH